MIVFKQKGFSEYDAMRSLYVEIMKRTHNDKRRFPIINTSALLPILKGNNIVVERFVISTSMFGKDKYRMYLKIGAKAKLPDEVRLPSKYYDERLGNMRLTINGSIFGQSKQKEMSERIKLFGGGNNKKKGPKPIVSAEMSPEIGIKRSVEKLLGEAIKYDKKARTLVLEFSSIDDAIEALNVLPFGIDYKIYLLDS